MEAYKVALVVALVALSASAAPLYEQQVELFEELLQQDKPITTAKEATKSVTKNLAKDVKKAVKTAAKAAAIAKKAPVHHGPLPFDHVTTKEETVYALDRKAHKDYDAYQTAKRLAPFKISEARDKAEEGERKLQDLNIKTARTTMDKAQVATDDEAVKADKAADKQATKTKETEMEKIHKILHPHKHEQEVADKDFLKRMAKQAAGTSVVINDDTTGNFFRPGGLGDHPDFAKKKKVTSAVKAAVKDAVKKEVAKATKKDAVKKETKAVAKAVAKKVAKAAAKKTF